MVYVVFIQSVLSENIIYFQIYNHTFGIAPLCVQNLLCDMPLTSDKYFEVLELLIVPCASKCILLREESRRRIGGVQFHQQSALSM